MNGRAARIAIAAIGSMLLLAGCAQSAGSSQSGQNYVSGDGTVTEFPLANREGPIEFSGTTETGDLVSSDQHLGNVLVVNFWYATCPPCRLEAPWLEELNQLYTQDGVRFLGVNIRDGAAAAQAFARKFDITYPSIIDTDGEVALAFSGIASPTAVPTTLVIDAEGRVASRIVGLIEKSTLNSLIVSALGESDED